MNKKMIFSFAAICLSMAGMAQTATTSGKTPAQEPASNEKTVPVTSGNNAVLMDKKATPDPAATNNQPEQQPAPAGNEKLTGQQKKPE